MNSYETSPSRPAASLRNGLPYRWWTMPEFHDLLAMVLCVGSLAMVGLVIFWAWWLS